MILSNKLEFNYWTKLGDWPIANQITLQKNRFLVSISFGSRTKSQAKITGWAMNNEISTCKWGCHQHRPGRWYRWYVCSPGWYFIHSQNHQRIHKTLSFLGWRFLEYNSTFYWVSICFNEVLAWQCHVYDPMGIANAVASSKVEFWPFEMECAIVHTPFRMRSWIRCSFWP